MNQKYRKTRQSLSLMLRSANTGNDTKDLDEWSKSKEMCLNGSRRLTHERIELVSVWEETGQS